MRDLNYILRSCFDRVHTCYGYRPVSNVRSDKAPLQMVIPISGDSLEVPVFALSSLGHNGADRDTEAIVANLEYIGRNTDYKSMDASIRDGLSSNFNRNNLILLPQAGSPSMNYYITSGAIFDKNYQPIMLASWALVKDYEGGSFKYRFMEPMLRVAPRVFTCKNDSVRRYVINRIIPEILSISRIWSPSMYDDGYFKNDNVSSKIKVVLEEMPFEMRRAKAPSISTTNEELLGIALGNMEELTQ